MRRTTRSSQKEAAESRATEKVVRCAVYTRKSTEEGLEQEFNSLVAQREAGEAFVRSQASEGWVPLPDRYDDGGYTGGNTDRPGLQRLLADIEAGKVDCVIVYKVDRLSRSLLDFARLMEAFEKHGVGFVSVTQAFHTGTSMGRLVLNVLLSFAQFERELVSERTRDKIAATRWKGKWAGGHPILGYDVDPKAFKLAVNHKEAERVRSIFGLYLEHESLLPVVEELARRGWVGKRWQTRKGAERGGQPFTRTSLYRLLTNVAFIGKVKYKDEVHTGEHPGIVDPKVFERVQALLRRNGTTGGAPVRNQFGAILKGLIRCAACDCTMTPAHTTRRNRRYRYYLCSSAQKKGWKTCPSRSLPAQQIEGFVLDRIRSIGRDPDLLHGVLDQVRERHAARTADIEAEQKGVEKELKTWHAEVRKLSLQLKPGENNTEVVRQWAELHERIALTEGRLRKLSEEVEEITHQMITDEEAAEALRSFDPVWGTLTPLEQARLIGLLVERVEFDGRDGRVTVTFHQTGIRSLSDKLAEHDKKESA